MKRKKVKCMACKFTEVIVGNDDNEITKTARAKFGSPSMICPQCTAKGRMSQMHLLHA